MSIYEIITRFDSLVFNTYSQSDKIKWLSILDAMVHNNIIKQHQGGQESTFDGYNDQTDIQNTKLLITEPYDDVYLLWLESKVCYHNGEYEKYNNAIIQFNNTLDAYASHYNRNNKPIPQGRFVF